MELVHKIRPSKQSSVTCMPGKPLDTPDPFFFHDCEHVYAHNNQINIGFFVNGTCILNKIYLLCSR